MVIEPKETTISYRCPHCGAGVISVVGVFTLTAEMFKLKCSCKKSEMTVNYTNDGKVRLTVPCIICPKPHIYTVSTSLFYGSDIFMLQCPYSDINICFMGELNHVKAELARSELQLLNLLEENGIDSFKKLHEHESETEDGAFPSERQIFDIIMFVVKELKDEHKIYCNCDDDIGGEYDIEVLDDAVRVFCKTCGASAVIPTDSTEAANDFLNSEVLYLY